METKKYLIIELDGNLSTRENIQIAIDGVNDIAPEELDHKPSITVEYTDTEAIIYSSNPLDYYLIGVNTGMLVEKILSEEK
jgi:hypothetical protein